MRDKAIHAVEYGILGWLMARALSNRTFGGWALTVGLAAIVGTVDEIYQSYVPGRFASVADALADLVGASVGAAAWVWLPWRRRRGRNGEGAIGG